MKIVLSQESAAIAEEFIASGKYSSPSAVVSAGLRLLTNLAKLSVIELEEWRQRLLSKGKEDARLLPVMENALRKAREREANEGINL